MDIISRNHLEKEIKDQVMYKFTYIEYFRHFSNKYSPIYRHIKPKIQFSNAQVLRNSTTDKPALSPKIEQ